MSRSVSERVPQLLLCCFLLEITTCFAQTFTDGPSAAVNADGRIEIFARGSDQAMWHNWQTSPGGSWAGWYSMGGIISGSPQVAVNADGRLVAFVRNPGNIAYYNYQTSPGGGWSGWIWLGANNITTPPAVARNFDGRLQVFAVGTDGAVWTACQMIPGGDWSAWTSLGGYVAADMPAVAQNADGRLEIFVRGTDNIIYHNYQIAPGGAWSGWGGPIGANALSAPSVGVNDDWRLEVFVEGTDGAGWHVWQTTPGGGWSSGYSLGGQISGSLSVELDGGTGFNGGPGLDVFAIAPNGEPFVDTQANNLGEWDALGGIITAAPAVAKNFDGRLEIFGIGTDGNMYHDWQVSPAGPWYGWQPIGVASNSGTANGADVPYFLTDAQNEQNYTNAKTSCGNPPWLSAATAWPCGARVNIGITGYDKKHLQWAHDAVKNWNESILQQFNGTAPVQLYISDGGPETVAVSRVCDTCIPGKDPDTYGRAENAKQNYPNGRLLSVEIHIIQGMTYSKTLLNAFAHELGHTFGLNDCEKCGPITVMDTDEKAPNGHGWDYVGKNFTEGLPGPTSCDLAVISSHLPDYTSCGMAENSPPPDQPTCTNGEAAGFADTGGSGSTYTCGGAACDGCNSNCNNFAPQQCGGGGSSGSCPDSALCNDYRTNVFATDFCKYPSGGCPAGWYQSNYCCYSSTNPPTPIIVDAFGEGFHMTGVSNGVQFRVFSGESPYQMSWTDPRWRNGWLALDRNGNGTIDDFTELFGNETVQPKSDDPNGYRALALFDDPMNGGNGNGVIDPDDSVYDNLRVWIDANHNGISEPEELHTLRELGIFQIDLRYTNSRYVDANGNQFRYRAKIKDEAGSESRFCYDVLVQIAPEAKN